MHLMLHIVVYRNHLQQFVEFQTEIQGSLRKLCVFKVSRGHPTKVAKLPIIASGSEKLTWNT